MIQTMTAEEFLKYVDKSVNVYRDKGKSRTNRAREWYALYLEIHSATSLLKIVQKASNTRHWKAIWKSADDRDRGIPPVRVDEFYDLYVQYSPKEVAPCP